MIFRGPNPLTMDAKGRIAIPTRYRQAIQDEYHGQLVVTIDFSGCLLLYPELNWAEVEEKLRGLPSTHKASRRLQRLMIGHATELEMDNQGRILLPSVLRDFAGLERQIMLAGQGNKFEIWSESAWNGLLEEMKQDAQNGETDLLLPEGVDLLAL